MAELDFYYPFDSVDGDRKTTAATERRFYNALFRTGVVGSGFAITQDAPGVYTIGTGVAIVGGSVCGITTPKQVTAQPAPGKSLYIVLRLDTTTAVRNISLEAVSNLEAATQAQLDEGGALDLALYSVTGQPAGVYGLLDQRTYCSTFDNAAYRAQMAAVIEETQHELTAEINALIEEAAGDIDDLEQQAAAAFSGALDGVNSNAIINGGFMVDQRHDGAEVSCGTGQRYIMDRWLFRIDGTPSEPFTARRGSLQSNNGSQPNFAAIINTKPLTGAGMAGLGQFIENGADIFGGEKMTVAFRANADTAQKLAVSVQVRYTASNIINLTAPAFDVVPGWNDYAITFEVPKQARDISNNIKVTIFTTWSGESANARFETAADNNAANRVYIADVRAVKGETAPPFSQAHFADEMERCRRYYRKLGTTTLAAGIMKTDKTLKTQALDFSGMRAAPAITTKDRNGTAGTASWELNTSGIEDGHVCAPTGNSDGFVVSFVVQPSSTAQVQAASILFSSIEADSEFVA